MQLSGQEETFSESSASFFKSSLNFEHFQKEDESHSWGISEITDSEKPC